MVWILRAHPHYKPSWFLGLCNAVSANCSSILEKMDPVTRRMFYVQMEQPGLEWNHGTGVYASESASKTENLSLVREGKKDAQPGSVKQSAELTRN